MYALTKNTSPTRCTVISLHETYTDAKQAADKTDTDISSMPAQIYEVDTGEYGPLEPGMRAYHNDSYCWS